MSTVTSSGDIAELQHRRREMRKELARVRWWRRLTHARRDLTVAHLASAAPLEAPGLDATWEALAADAPTSAELERAIFPDAGAPGASTLEQLDRLDERLATYESRVTANLENVTARMVDAMGAQHRASKVSGGARRG